MSNSPEVVTEQVILTREHLPLYGLTLKKVERATLHDGFPPAIRLGARSRGWFRRDVEAWLREQPRGAHPCLGTGQFAPERIEEQQRKRHATMQANRQARDAAE